MIRVHEGVKKVMSMEIKLKKRKQTSENEAI